VPIAIDIGDRERRLDANVVYCADAPQEIERRAIAAEEHVLTVVDELSRLAIDERGRPAAELRSRVEYEYASTGLCQPRGCAEACDAGADDGD
jgi:hypothetical protein